MFIINITHAKLNKFLSSITYCKNRIFFKEKISFTTTNVYLQSFGIVHTFIL